MTVKQAREEMNILINLQKNLCGILKYYTQFPDKASEIENESRLNDELRNVISDAITVIESKSKELNDKIEKAEI